MRDVDAVDRDEIEKKWNWEKWEKDEVVDFIIHTIYILIMQV